MNATVRMLVGGSRNWSDVERVRWAMARVVRMFGVTEVWSGGARGADCLGEQVARELGLVVVVRPADWAGEGRAAGVRRTERMLREMEGDVCLVFWDGESRGTGFTIECAGRLGFRLVLVLA